MGVVYQAEQMTLGRQVALKVLPRNLFADLSASERFQLEAAAAASLHHTNIVPVHEAGQENGTHFYAMQLIEGESLAQVIRSLRSNRTTEKARTAGARQDLHQQLRRAENHPADPGQTGSSLQKNGRASHHRRGRDGPWGLAVEVRVSATSPL